MAGLGSQSSSSAPTLSSWQFYGTNAYEAAINGIVGDVLLILRTKRTPGFETLLKHFGIKAVINIIGSAIANYLPVGGIAPLDMEYLSTSLAAVLLNMFMKEGMTWTYAAGEQALVSIISHALTTGSVIGAGSVFTSLGNSGGVNVNSASNY
jgi:hypothetical protein